MRKALIFALLFLMVVVTGCSSHVLILDGGSSENDSLYVHTDQPISINNTVNESYVALTYSIP